MKAFISYSHKDDSMLQMLHKHLAQLQRDRLITAWTDNEIKAGGDLDKTISYELSQSQIFIALLSPDYIMSQYCFDKEFQTALEMQEQGKIIIVPIVVEPCDWQNTPFTKFKALPKDAKAVSIWENINTAFLDVVQNIRKLVTDDKPYVDNSTTVTVADPLHISRNYKVKKDFDSIEKIHFAENTFKEIKDYLRRYIAEIAQIENIKGLVKTDTEILFECIVVNRNKINVESNLLVTTEQHTNSLFSGSSSSDKQINYSINQYTNQQGNRFIMKFDDYHLFWSRSDYMSRDIKELNSKEIADLIWEECLSKAGIG